MKNNFEDLLKRTGTSPEELLRAKKELLEQENATDSMEKSQEVEESTENEEEGFSVPLDIFGEGFQEIIEPETSKTESPTLDVVEPKDGSVNTSTPLTVEDSKVIDSNDANSEANTVVVESAPIKDTVEEQPLSVSLDALNTQNKPKPSAPRRESKPQTQTSSVNPFGQSSKTSEERSTWKSLGKEFVKAFNVKENVKSKSLRPWVILSSGITTIVFVLMLFVSLLGTVDFAEETPQQVQEVATNVVDDFENADLSKSTKQLMEEKSLSEGFPSDFYEVKERAAVFAKSKSMDFVLTPMYKGKYKDLSTSVVFYDVTPSVKDADKDKVSFAVERAIEKKDKEGLSKEHLRAIEELIRINLSSQTKTKYRVQIKSIWF